MVIFFNRFKALDFPIHQKVHIVDASGFVNYALEIDVKFLLEDRAEVFYVGFQNVLVLVKDSPRNEAEPQFRDCVHRVAKVHRGVNAG